MPGQMNKENEAIWDRAKAVFSKTYKKEPTEDQDFSIVSSIFSKMGGTFDESLKQLARKCLKKKPKFLEKIKTMKEGNESIIIINGRRVPVTIHRDGKHATAQLSDNKFVKQDDGTWKLEESFKEDKVYVTSSNPAPKGVQLQTGPRGGKYYNDNGVTTAQPAQKPAAKQPDKKQDSYLDNVVDDNYNKKLKTANPTLHADLGKALKEIDALVDSGKIKIPEKDMQRMGDYFPLSNDKYLKKYLTDYNKYAKSDKLTNIIKQLDSGTKEEGSNELNKQIKSLGLTSSKTNDVINNLNDKQKQKFIKIYKKYDEFDTAYDSVLEESFKEDLWDDMKNRKLKVGDKFQGMIITKIEGNIITGIDSNGKKQTINLDDFNESFKSKIKYMKEQMSLDEAAMKKFGKRYSQLTDDEKKECNYVRDEWNDDFEEGLRAIEVTYSDGTVRNVDMAAHLTDEEMKNYFKVGKQFNIGNGDKDKMVTVKSTKILESIKKENIGYNIIAGELNQNIKNEMDKLINRIKKYPNINITDNKYFLYDGNNLVAAQTSESGIMKYYKPGRTIIELTESIKKEAIAGQIIVKMIDEGKTEEEILDALKYTDTPVGVLKDSIAYYMKNHKKESYKTKIKKTKEDISDNIADEALKMFYDGLKKDVIINRLKDKYPNVSVVTINDIVDKIFEKFNKESYKEKIKEMKESLEQQIIAKSIEEGKSNDEILKILDYSKIPRNILLDTINDLRKHPSNLKQ